LSPADSEGSLRRRGIRQMKTGYTRLTQYLQSQLQRTAHRSETALCRLPAQIGDCLGYNIYRCRRRSHGSNHLSCASPLMAITGRRFAAPLPSLDADPSSPACTTGENGSLLPPPTPNSRSQRFPYFARSCRCALLLPLTDSPPRVRVASLVPRPSRSPKRIRRIRSRAICAIELRRSAASETQSARPPSRY
jgi:hypothetical protein